jgi:hypothetical protein
MSGERPGTGLPGYVLREPIGSGPSSRVWRAEPRDRPGRVVAIKRIALAPDPRAVVTFRQRAARLAQLSHPGILPLLNVIDDGDGVALVTPYAPGGTLADRIARRGGGLPPGIVAGLGADLATALGAAHAEGLVHGDVKPSNVLFDAEGQPLLADFGVAALLTGARGPADSPDTVRPHLTDAVASDPRGDVRGLGLTLNAALARETPERTGQPERRPTRGRESLAPALPSGIPERLVAAIDRAIQDDADGATTTAADLANDLGEARNWAEDHVGSGASPETVPANDAAMHAAARTPVRLRPPRGQHGRSGLAGHRRSPGDRPGTRIAPATARNRRLLIAVATLVLTAPVVLGAWVVSTRVQPSVGVSTADDVSDTALVAGDPDRVPPEPCGDVSLNDSDEQATTLIADIDGVGCGVPISWVDGELVVASAEGPERRFDLDADPDDVLLAGDWTCDGRDGIALYRPASGEVFRFDRVDERDGEVLATAERIGEPGGQARVVTDADGCDRIVVDNS